MIGFPRHTRRRRRYCIWRCAIEPDLLLVHSLRPALDCKRSHDLRRQENPVVDSRLEVVVITIVYNFRQRLVIILWYLGHFR